METYRSNLIMGSLNIVLVLSTYIFLAHIAHGNLDDFDCVDIYKQPAFQHPLLKDHKIQEKFSDEKEDAFYKIETNTETYKSLPMNESCPEGKVAILKQKNGTSSFHTDSFEYPREHFAAIENMDGQIYTGAEAGFTIHAVQAKKQQYSKAQIWFENGPRKEVNSIQVGWAVHPSLYGDSNTRFTIRWTGDGYRKTGCYNAQCPGFVILTRHPVIGAVFSVSLKNITHLVGIEVEQDEFSGNWVLRLSGYVVGYWPSELFTHLKKGASLVRFGGKTLASPDGYSPAMGNGRYPVLNYDKDSYFKHIALAKGAPNRMISIQDTKQRTYADNPCYRVSFWAYIRYISIDFAYGGPGGHCGI